MGNSTHFLWTESTWAIVFWSLSPLTCFRKIIEWEKFLLQSSYCLPEAEKSPSKCWHSTGFILHQKSCTSFVRFCHNPISSLYSGPRIFMFWWSNWTSGSASAATSNWTISSFSAICSGRRSNALTWITSLEDALEEALGWSFVDLQVKPNWKSLDVFFICSSSFLAVSCCFFVFLHRFGTSSFRAPTFLV